MAKAEAGSRTNGPRFKGTMTAIIILCVSCHMRRRILAHHGSHYTIQHTREQGVARALASLASVERLTLRRVVIFRIVVTFRIVAA